MRSQSTLLRCRLVNIPSHVRPRAPQPCVSIRGNRLDVDAQATLHNNNIVRSARDSTHAAGGHHAGTAAACAACGAAALAAPPSCSSSALRKNSPAR